MTVRQVLARVEVADLEVAIPGYLQLAGVVEVRRFSFGRVEVAWVGPFVLLAGPPAALLDARRTATLLVDDLAEVQRVLYETGGVVLERPAAGPNGRRMIARHADGAVFEYIEP